MRELVGGYGVTEGCVRKGPMTVETTSEIAERHGDREAVLARLSFEWTVLHQMPWPGRRDGFLDHVAIGPTGVYVIVVGDDVREAAAGADAVAGYLPGLPRASVHGVLVGANHPAPWVEVDGAIRCESVDLARLLRSRPRTLTNEQVAGIIGVVHVGLERSERARAAADLVVRSDLSAGDAAVDAMDAAESTRGAAPRRRAPTVRWWTRHPA